ncbi:anti-anti-sigma factor [Chloroflexus islandicus]|uniref:Anti-anti-sigma factor n=1 Tax=Chloroflexus islandicus TaxID=1707952 RepID=A0A178MNU7_9CHLR|nr:STAS domain-containing protein [Chloroflexus islandicus]OAN49697.1 anti-anti-sigma factor [Chloroflexus islandicus]
MWKLIAHFVHVKASNPDQQRRGQLLVTLSAGVVVILLTAGLLLTMLQPTIGRFINLGLATLVFSTAAFLGRQGFVSAGSYILIIVAGIGSLSGLFFNPDSPFNIIYLLICVLLSSILLKPNQIWIVLAGCLAALAVVVVTVPVATRSAILLDYAAAHVSVLLTVTALITFIGARSLAAALAEARELRRQAEEANQRLVQVNAGLEARIAERTEALQRLADEQRATMSQLAESLRSQQELNQLILELDVPIIPVRDDTLVVPLVGGLDSHRVQRLFENVLPAIERAGARLLVIDVTGVAVIDTYAAAALLQVAQAARLMGVTTTLAGIRPEVAQTLVSLGIDLSSIHTASTLQAALRLQPQMLSAT